MMAWNTALAALTATALLTASCATVETDKDEGANADTDTDTDTDTDADTDADADGDTDGDTDTDTDSDTNECVPSCDDKECGDDGCGGYCGACDAPPDDSCLDGGVLQHADDDQIGVCDAFDCEYEVVEHDCPGASACQTDTWGGFACVGSVPHGTVDAASSTLINGWACDVDAPWATIDLHLYFDSVPGDASPIVRVVAANVACEQGVTDSCGGGEFHRYAFAPDAALLSLLGSGAHTVYVFAIDTDGYGYNPQINNSPQVFTVP